jgi:hypothetical protein
MEKNMTTEKVQTTDGRTANDGKTHMTPWVARAKKKLQHE